jgi:hypothetical protein
MRSLFLRIALPLLGAALLSGGAVAAQGMNYVDEAGNIYFVDSIDQVPQQYRSQLVPPKPTLPPGSKVAREYENQLKRQQKELEREKKKKEREKENARKKAEKEKLKKEREEARAKKKKKSD